MSRTFTFWEYRDGALVPYLNAVRWISLSIHPYLSLLWVFYAGIPGTFEDDSDENDEYAVISHHC
jgi:hypothetical protein